MDFARLFSFLSLPLSLSLSLSISLSLSLILSLSFSFLFTKSSYKPCGLVFCLKNQKRKTKELMMRGKHVAFTIPLFCFQKVALFKLCPQETLVHLVVHVQTSNKIKLDEKENFYLFCAVNRWA